MEDKLKNLFDYQKFEKNEKLENLITDTMTRNKRMLDDDDMSLVNAAGDFNMPGGTVSGNSDGSKAWYGLENKDNKDFNTGSRFWEEWLNGRPKE